MNVELSLIERAARIAAVAHKEQKRKSDGSPYVVHPFMVSRLLTEYGFGEDVVAAGLVHDVLEDTAVTESELRADLGDAVVAIVCAVSEDMSLQWEVRKKTYADTVSHAPEAVKAVSICDKIHNLETMLRGAQEQGEPFWDHFTRGKADQQWLVQTLLAAYKEGWDHPLIERYQALVDKFLGHD